MQVTPNAAMACTKLLTPITSTCTELTTQSHRKYPAAKAWHMPAAPLYPQSRSAQFPGSFCTLRAGSVKMTHSAAALINSAWYMDTMCASQFNLLRRDMPLYFCGHSVRDSRGEPTRKMPS